VPTTFFTSSSTSRSSSTSTTRRTSTSRRTFPTGQRRNIERREISDPQKGNGPTVQAFQQLQEAFSDVEAGIRQSIAEGRTFPTIPETTFSAFFDGLYRAVRPAMADYAKCSAQNKTCPPLDKVIQAQTAKAVIDLKQRYPRMVESATRLESMLSSRLIAHMKVGTQQKGRI
jgi:hypothetical protein